MAFVRLFITGLLVGGSLHAGLPTEKSIAWRSTFDEASADAKANRQLVLVAVNMDGEAANDRLALVVYRDPRVLTLTAGTQNVIGSIAEHAPAGEICPRFGSVTCDEHRKVERAVRKLLHKGENQRSNIAPQHLFLDPDGEVLFSIPYEITADELEWCLVIARLHLDPEADVERSAKAAKPKRLVPGTMTLEELARTAIGRAQAFALIQRLKHGLEGQQRMEAIELLLTADEPKAVDYLRSVFKTRGGTVLEFQFARVLRLMGARSPERYWKLLGDYADIEDVVLREEVAVALEGLGAPPSLRSIRRALRDEESPGVQGVWVRALGSAGAGDKRTRRDLLKMARKEEGLLRANAIVATGYLTPGPDVVKLFEEIAAKGTDADRVAAALCIVMHGREDLEPYLSKGLAADAEKKQRDLLDAALRAMKQENPDPLKGPFKKALGASVLPPRFFGLE